MDAGDTMSAIKTSVIGSDGGAFTINSDFTYTFDPLDHFNDLLAEQTRTTSITYSVTDNHGATDTATLTITVMGVADGTNSANSKASSPLLAAAEKDQNDLTQNMDAPHQVIGKDFGHLNEPVFLAAMGEHDPLNAKMPITDSFHNDLEGQSVSLPETYPAQLRVVGDGLSANPLDDTSTVFGGKEERFISQDTGDEVLGDDGIACASIDYDTIST